MEDSDWFELLDIVIIIYTPSKYGHLGVPIFTWFWGPHYEYRDLLLPVKVHSNTGSMVQFSRHVKCKMSEYNVGKSGAEGITLHTW